MKKSFGAKRVARKIGGDDDEDGGLSGGSMTAASSESEAPSFVKRPSNKSRKSSSLRTSFGVIGGDDDGDISASGVVTPKRNNLSKVAIQRNAERRLAADVPFRGSREGSEERPTYSRTVLDELKQSTPSTPRDLSVSTTDVEDTGETPGKAVDLASKFGNSLSRYQAPSAIPTDAEIQEKKLRRARLAKEQEYISLDANSEDEDLDENVTRDENGKLILKPQDKYPETRLVRDDEDIFEDFDDFTTDGKMALGRKAEKEAEIQRRAEMAALIDQAEGQSDDAEEDDSEAERNAAFESAQTRSGTYGSRADDADSARPRTPPKITPLPTLDGVMSRLRARLEEMEVARTNKAQELDSLRAERTQIGSEEVRVQTALKETAEKFTKLRESITSKSDNTTELSMISTTNGHTQSMGRGGLGFGAGLGSERASAEDDSSRSNTPMSVGGAGSGDSDY
ncbi:nineteen complex-related protein 2-domain-containing protein [Elsinoe ampelina]|uniref:Nineteen complex-related protein 2-domain-containing protein n=1 Tax=Elsinoe ampelina TaxID=302913 RepID=A0A6A6GF67_9PEZI|nr:nineteen complex-related protein 2-domain-containing protein [Elsinoe ampelina]